MHAGPQAHRGVGIQEPIALFGTVMASREASAAETKSRLAEVLTAHNQGLSPGVLLTPLRATEEPGFHAVFARPEAVVEVARAVADAVFPARIAMGLGRGPLHSGLGRARDDGPPWSSAAELEGPCIQRARAALLDARRRGAWLVASGFGRPADELLSSLFELMGALRSGWTARQAATVAMARGRLQREVAEAFGVSPSVVSESLKASHASSLARAEQAAASALAEYGFQADVPRALLPRPSIGPQ